MNLNQGQREALDALMTFLVNDQKYFVLEGAGGCGKTTVIKELRDAVPRLNDTLELLGLPRKSGVSFCASTNKAATLFDHTTTIHKLLRLRVTNDYKTGRTNLVQDAPVHFSKLVIVIDEASMLDSDLLHYIEISTANTCKIIFLLDRCQLAPIGKSEPLVHTLGYPTATLTEPMRQGAESYLYQQCIHFRKGVEEQLLQAPVSGPGVTIAPNNDFLNEAVTAFRRGENARVLAFTNSHVEALNAFIRNKLNGDNLIRVGDTLTLATAKESSKFVVEGTYKVLHVGKLTKNFDLEVIPVTFQGAATTEIHHLPVNKKAYFAKLSELKKAGHREGLWKPYFTFLNEVSDFRDTYACTVHKSQGSTYDRVFIDYSDLQRCADLNTLVRLCYVAISRARHEAIYFTGE